MLDIFDDALARFYSRLKHGGQTLPFVFAPVQRARGTLYSKLAQDERIKLVDRKQQPIPLPYISIHRQRPVNDQSRAFAPAVASNLAPDLASGTTLSARAPKPVTMAVQTEFWCRTEEEQDALEAQLLLQFDQDSVLLPIDWSNPMWYKPPYSFNDSFRYMGRDNVVFVDEGCVDNTDLATANEDELIFRTTHSGRLEGYLPRVPVLGKLAKRIEVEVIADNESAGTFVVEEQ